MNDEGRGCLGAMLLLVFLPLIFYNFWQFWGGYQDKDVYEMGWHGFWMLFWNSMGNTFFKWLNEE